jgi:hypothetical protein
MVMAGATGSCGPFFTVVRITLSGEGTGLGINAALAPAAAAELLRLAIADPARASARADVLLAATDDDWWQSVAHHARGVAVREQGRTAEAVRELRAAARFAARSGDVDRDADVRASLGLALGLLGRTRASLAELDRAVEQAHEPRMRASVLFRRGYALSILQGRNEDALIDLRQALAGTRKAGDRIFEARTLNTMSRVLIDVGDFGRAGRALERAHELFTEMGQEIEAVQAEHSMGWLAYCRGDLVDSLRRYDEAAQSYRRLGLDPVQLARDQCQALLAAGLPTEACVTARTALERDRIEPVIRAELELSLAISELARGNAEAARAAAGTARTRFRLQARAASAVSAELVLLGARRQIGERGRRLATAAARVAAELEAARSEEAPAAWLLAGDAASEAGVGTASEMWRAAGRYRSHRSGLVRATAWLALAHDRAAGGDRRGTWSACRRGLDVLDEYRSTWGSTELRALAAVHGDELARLGVSQALAAGPRAQLWWSERWRATALAQPPVRPSEDADEAGLFARLREVGHRLEEARSSDASTAALESERGRLEVVIQRRRRLAESGGRGPERLSLDVDRLVDEVGSATFVELLETDGRLRAIVVSGRRVRAYDVGSATHAVEAVASARFVLRQAARGRPVRLAEVGTQLQTALLGPAVAAFGTGRVVVSPTAALHATPWGLLPALTGVPVTVVPTASAWLRARGSRARRRGRVLVVGPGLASGGAEVPSVAAHHPDAVVLGGGSATVDESLRAMDGAELVHVAAHGRFRADNPLFSALELDDGPLTVHDFERLRRAPRRFVLSACESGMLVPVGAHELLGLATALMSMGTVGILSSVAPVNDEATAELMVEVHRGLDDVDDLGVVMQRVRALAAGDVVRQATAAAFVALGV